MIRPEDFTLLAGVIRKRSGIVLAEDKTYLLESRLMPLVRTRGLDSMDALVASVRKGGDEPLLREITDAMTTNETLFFRDIRPFDQFRDVMVPALTEARASQKKIRVWCAACSTGQEPYSLAMVIKELGAKLAGYRIEFIATDLSTEALAKAKAGIYSQFEVQRGLPVSMLVKYFQQQNDAWQVNSEIRAMVRYEELNLLKDFSKIGPVDIVFCRNVLIYFDPETKKDILERAHKLLPDDGYLLLGGSETVLGVTEKFGAVDNQRGLYRPL